MKNFSKLFGIISLFTVIGFSIAGCVSYSHIQAVRNEIGVTVTEVYIRDAGTSNWGNVRNVRARTDSEGRVLRGADGSVAYWDRYNMNNATEIVFFRDSSSSGTPKGIRNQDIAVKDSNGLSYMKQNVPITFTTKKSTDYILIGGPSEVITTSNPIVFTVRDRLPMLFVVNQTEYPVTLTAPIQDSIIKSGRTQFQPMEINKTINVAYRIGQAQYTEQVTMGNEDTTVTLTKRPPNITITNNVGVTINMIFLRQPNSAEWIGGNIVTRDGTVHLAKQAQTGDISGSIVNRDSMRIWLGNIPISGDRFDIRIDDVQLNTYVKNNVEVTSDLNMDFTQSDKR